MQKCQLCGRWIRGKKADHVCPPPLDPRTCPICGQVFTPLKDSQICCSIKCGRIRQKRESYERVRQFREKEKEDRETRRCAICEEEFIPRSHNQLVCEKQSCRAEYKKRYDAARYKGDFTPAPWYGQFCMPDPYQGKKLYFDGLHSVRGSMPGKGRRSGSGVLICRSIAVTASPLRKPQGTRRKRHCWRLSAHFRT